jgi:DnaJ-class molecular chaperone
MTYKELSLAREVFGLGERATLKEVKSRHRHLVKLHHPDTGHADNPEQIRRINLAYQVLLDYLTQYSFSFSEAEFYEQNPDERLRRQFMDEAQWGGR